METKKQHSENEEKKSGYQCPMHCEKDKVYDHPGNCPDCNMKLVPIGDNSSSGSQGHCC